MSAEGTGETGYEVLIEGEIHAWGSDTISVAEIRELGDFPEDARVAAVGHAQGAEHPGHVPRRWRGTCPG
jgi:kynurenine formamidase